MSWLFHAVREIIAWILSTIAVLIFVPAVLFLVASFIVSRPTAERYMRGLSGAWEASKRK